MFYLFSADGFLSLLKWLWPVQEVFGHMSVRENEQLEAGPPGIMFMYWNSSWSRRKLATLRRFFWSSVYNPNHARCLLARCTIRLSFIHGPLYIIHCLFFSSCSPGECAVTSVAWKKGGQSSGCDGTLSAGWFYQTAIAIHPDTLHISIKRQITCDDFFSLLLTPYPASALLYGAIGAVSLA